MMNMILCLVFPHWAHHLSYASYPLVLVITVLVAAIRSHLRGFPVTQWLRICLPTDTEDRLMDTGRGEQRVRCMGRVTWKLTIPYVR